MTRGELWWADFGIPFGSEKITKLDEFIIEKIENNILFILGITKV